MSVVKRQVKGVNELSPRIVEHASNARDSYEDENTGGTFMTGSASNSRAALALVGTLTCLACGGAGTAPVSAVVVMPSTADLQGGQTTQLTATPTDAGGNALTGRAVTWGSDNASVAAVSGTGVVTALATGTANITATSEGQHGSAAISAHLVFASVSVATNHTCGATPSAAAAFCWGDNSVGQLGVAAAAGPHQCSGNPCSTRPFVVPEGVSFAAVSVATTAYGCGVTPLRKLYCWGEGGYGELANGVASTSPAYFGPAATTLSFASVSAGHLHACGLTPAGAGYCWGRMYRGLLGDGGTADTAVAVPVAVAGGLTFRIVSSGEYHTCGVTIGGAGYCWGRESLDGALGDSSYSDSPVPVAVAGGLTFTMISAATQFSCGLTTAGTAYCWGLGAPNYPVAVSGGLTFNTIATGGTQTCAITTVGAAYCWGGNGTQAPAVVPGGLSFAAISVSDLTACGVTTNGTAYCWGDNSVGQLGDGTTTNSTMPVKVAGQP